MTARVAIDIGGTFTDVILSNDKYEILAAAKIPSHSDRPQEPFFKGFRDVLERAGVDTAEVLEILHGTTLVTNVLLEGKTAKVGLFVTRGFRHLLEIGRQQRPSLYHLDRERPTPLVSYEDIIEIKERVSSTGKTIVPLDEKRARNVVSRLEKNNIHALAVSLLFSYMNPDHERRLKRLVRRKFRGLPAFLSSEISPEFREFERTSTTVISAAVAPKVLSYLRAIGEGLAKNGIRPHLGIMHSGGGVMGVEEAIRRPHALIESGPAAGIIGAEHLARILNLEKIIAFDMGGTTAKAGLVLGKRAQFSQEFEVGGELHHGGRVRGSGYPVRTPMVDVVECGAGAGSMAWIDKGGHLKVGPRSAGAYPGPACYGKGGTEATVADAQLVLGRLSADGFLGGEMPLHPELAERAVQRNIGRPLNMSLEEAAAGILEVANASMLRILRLVSIARGHDPRAFTLVAYGGAGPMHATALAEKMSIGHVVIPRLPGLFSTVGLLCADRSTDFVATAMIPVKRLSPLKRLIGGLQKQARAWFLESGASTKDRKTELSADLRYLHQSYEINLPLPGPVVSAGWVRSVERDFHKKHAQTYGLAAPGDDIQVVHLRLRASLPRAKPRLRSYEPGGDSFGQSKPSPRYVWFRGKPRRCRVFDRSSLQAGRNFRGPMIIQETDSTTVVDPGWSVRVDSQGNLHLRKMRVS